MNNNTKRRGVARLAIIGGLATSATLAVGAYFFLAPNASAGPAELNYVCGGNNPASLSVCHTLASEYSKQSGVPVKVITAPDNSSLYLSVLQESALTRAPVDVFEIDVIWPGILANDVLDLKPYFSQAELADFFPSLVANNTIDGKLLAIPVFTDTGVLFYRKDLLAKYGYSGPPKTWQELTQMGEKIQAGERAAGSKDFYGYVWQGAQYEGLTCDALEWLTTYGAGSVVESDGSISINNPKAIAALEMARGWVGTISPKNVGGLREESTRDIWRKGRAAFMRNWPYAYTLGNTEAESQIKGQFDAAPLPAGPSGKSAATLGGWQLAVNKYTRFPKEAANFVKFLTSAAAQKNRVVKSGSNPTLRSLYKDPEVLAANPFFARMGEILNNATSRPSGVTAARYDVVSTAFYTAVHSVLTGSTPADKAVAQLESNLKSIKGEGW